MEGVLVKFENEKQQALKTYERINLDWCFIQNSNIFSIDFYKTNYSVGITVLLFVINALKLLNSCSVLFLLTTLLTFFFSF